MQEINTTLLHLGKNETPMSGNYDYSKFKDLEDFDLDDELIEKFNPIAHELNLSQESVETLLDLALEMSKKQKYVLSENSDYKRNCEIQKYYTMAKNDAEIPDFNSVKLKEYVRIADLAYEELASDKLKKVFSASGLNYHPELIKMFHKIGELMEEDGVEYFSKQKEEELTPAEILYGKPEWSEA